MKAEFVLFCITTVVSHIIKVCDTLCTRASQ